MQVSLGQGCPTASTIHVHLHAYAGTTMLVEFILGISDNITFQRSTTIALCHTDSIKLIPIGTFTFAHSLYAPLELYVRRKNVLGLRSCEQLADSIHITLVSETYYTTIGTLSKLQFAQQGVLLLEALYLCLSSL